MQMLRTLSATPKATKQHHINVNNAGCTIWPPAAFSLNLSGQACVPSYPACKGMTSFLLKAMPDSAYLGSELRY